MWMMKQRDECEREAVCVTDGRAEGAGLPRAAGHV